MRVLHGINGLRLAPRGSVVTIGNFDGVHRGHQRILEFCRNLAGEPAPVVVVTFEPHPLTVLRPQAVPPRLTPSSLKEELIQALGADFYVVLPPEPAVLNLTAEDFWKILRDEVQPSHLVEGSAFTFGKGRGGDVQKLAEWSRDSQVQFDLVEPLSAALLDLKLVQISSSLVRWLLRQGRVRDAAIALGRPYTLRGAVVKGFGRGRKIGVPTANLQCNEQTIPADAVYAGRCRIGSAVYPAAVSIGDMPTFGEGVRQIEAHLLDFEGDLYGKTLDLELVDWLRDQWKFSGVDGLKDQIKVDILRARRRSGMDPSRPIAEAELAL